ncbi:VOC family protein [Phytoactinopolyspora endophytica]|uniref:VOC family protein n=1 Tax=Phytoactinopolyspora endophytica TaxID=1642495 RepID=UPI00101CD0CA|nr:VOC family protein [Phytoactinopolyspora endophytica]
MRTLLVGLRVTDLDRSTVFYQALGYTVVGQVPETAFGTLTMLQLPDDPFVTVELVHDPSRPIRADGGLNHLAIKVEDLHATIATLAANGIEADPADPTADPDEPLVSHLRDPDGYLIELVQWPEGHSDGITEDDFTSDQRRDNGKR